MIYQIRVASLEGLAKYYRRHSCQRNGGLVAEETQCFNGRLDVRDPAGLVVWC